MGIPLLRGRTFGADDSPSAPAAAIVNESMARRFWPNGDALGKRVLWGGRRLTIVGVAGDVPIDGLDRTVNPTIYTSVFQVQSGATRNAVFILRASLDVPSLTNAVRSAIWSVDRDVPVFDVRSMIDVVSRSLGARRFAAVTMSSFGVVALALAMIGLYDVLSHAVAQRQSEFGLRLALGSSPMGLLALVLTEGMRLTVIGILLGGLLAVAVARPMSGLLFGIGTFDPLTFGSAIALSLVVALLANLVPASRAARSDPMVALRAE